MTRPWEKELRIWPFRFLRRPPAFAEAGDTLENWPAWAGAAGGIVGSRWPSGQQIRLDGYSLENREY